MSDVIAQAVMSGVAMGLITGILLLIVRVYRKISGADVRGKDARRRRLQAKPTSSGIKNMQNTRRDDQERTASSEYHELSRRIEHRAANIVKTSGAVATGAVRGVNSSLPKWLKVVLLIAAGWIALLVIDALLSNPRYPY